MFLSCDRIASLILRIAIRAGSVFYWTLGDKLDITDATKIQQYLADLSDPYGIGELVTVNTFEQ